MLAIALIAWLATAADAPLPVADGIQLLEGKFVPGTQPDGNTVMIRAPDGYVVVDSGRHAAHAQRILEFARAGGAPIVAVVNTHWHLDHVGGNPRLRAVYPSATIHSSAAIDAALGGFLANYREQLVGLAEAAIDEAAAAPLRAEIALIDAGAALKPDHVVRRAGVVTLGGHQFELGLERAATAGDVWLYDPATRTLVAGDLVTLPVPFLDTACPRRWRKALARLDGVRFEQLVPGHGTPMSRGEFSTYRTAFGELLDCAGSGADASACTEGWLAGTASLREETDPRFARELVAYYVGEVLRGDPARIERNCSDG